ncbi:hypothetical protein [Nonomuraea cavernae]|nr:hypothetical protein [Nonomuraea cavernae]MCA2185817.1 hypothetical protein [Nonomuraea cavernae]
MADVGDQGNEHDSPTTPFRKIVLPAEETVQIRRPPAPRPVPPPPPPPKRGLAARIGDIPIRVVYLIGAILATVAAVLLIFTLFSGDVPGKDEQSARVVPVAPVPGSVTPSASASATPSPTVSEVALPPVPKAKVFADLPGTASVVTGIINDTKNGISYPRLGDPWTARSFPPFTVAQRVGKVAVPHTVIASAMFPAEAPETKPSTDADYREIAARAARWTLRSQYPAGATLAWTGSQKVPVGKGWTLAYRVTYTLSGKRQSAQALVSVVEVGKTKPAMLLASIPQSGRSHWRDLNTLATRVRPL